MTQIYVIGQDDLTAIETPSSSSTKDGNSLATTSNDENTPNADTREESISSNTENVESPSNPSTVDQDDLQIDLELEKSLHEWKANLRVESFKGILCGSSSQFSWPEFILHVTGTIFISFVLTTPNSLIPAENVFHRPDSWHQILLPQVVYCVINSTFLVLCAGNYMNLSCIKSVRHILVLSLITIVIAYAFFFLTHFLWVYVLKYTFPVPLLGVLYAYVLEIVAPISLWFQFPLKFRKDITFRRRMKYFIALKYYFVFITLQYNIATPVLLLVKNKYQPMLAFFVPFLKKINGRVVNNWIGETSNGDKLGSKLTVTYAYGCVHGIALCFMMGSVATDVTSWMLVTMDFLDNVHACLMIVLSKKRNPLDFDTQISLLQNLAISELIEFTSPLTFLLSFLGAYYGPNSSLFGDINCDLWHFRKVEDIRKLLTNVAMLFFADLSSVFVTSVILWTFCRINLLRAIMAIQKEFGLVMFAVLAFLVFAVRAQIFIFCN